MVKALATEDDARALLVAHGIQPTMQRVVIARRLFQGCAHFSAEDLFALINRDHNQVSKATVYNTLGLFAECGLVREVIADPKRVYYDTNLAPHHHIFNVENGQLTDIPASSVEISRLPEAPPGTAIDGVDVIVRVRPESVE